MAEHIDERIHALEMNFDLTDAIINYCIFGGRELWVTWSGLADDEVNHAEAEARAGHVGRLIADAGFVVALDPRDIRRLRSEQWSGTATTFSPTICAASNWSDTNETGSRYIDACQCLR